MKFFKIAWKYDKGEKDYDKTLLETDINAD